MMKRILLAISFLLFTAIAFGQARNKSTDTPKTKPAGIKSPFRMHFNQLFRQNADNSYSPVLPLMINGEMIPTSTKLANGVKYGGLDLMANTNRDLLVDTLRGVVIVHGFVKQE
jgi:hypothetical protein